MLVVVVVVKGLVVVKVLVVVEVVKGLVVVMVVVVVMEEKENVGDEAVI